MTQPGHDELQRAIGRLEGSIGEVTRRLESIENRIQTNHLSREADIAELHRRIDEVHTRINKLPKQQVVLDWRVILGAIMGIGGIAAGIIEWLRRSG